MIGAMMVYSVRVATASYWDVPLMSPGESPALGAAGTTATADFCAVVWGRSYPQAAVVSATDVHC